MKRPHDRPPDHPERLFDGRDLLTGKALFSTAGRVVDMADVPKKAIAVRGILKPGFVGLQVNGGG